jgi:hypothetical protein
MAQSRGAATNRWASRSAIAPLSGQFCPQCHELDTASAANTSVAMADRTCQRCLKVFDAPCRLKQHSERARPCKEPIPEKEVQPAVQVENNGAFHCDRCDKRYSSIQSLQRHRRTVCRFKPPQEGIKPPQEGIKPPQEGIKPQPAGETRQQSSSAPSRPVIAIVSSDDIAEGRKLAEAAGAGVRVVVVPGRICQLLLNSCAWDDVIHPWDQ